MNGNSAVCIVLTTLHVLWYCAKLMLYKNIYSLFEQMTIREKMGEKRHHTRSTQKLGRIYEEENKREKKMREHFDFESPCSTVSQSFKFTTFENPKPEKNHTLQPSALKWLTSQSAHE